MTVSGVMLDSKPDGREVVTVWYRGNPIAEVAYDGQDRAEAHRVHSHFLMQMPHWRAFLAERDGPRQVNPAAPA
jgi:hypothetical protein